MKYLIPLAIGGAIALYPVVAQADANWVRVITNSVGDEFMVDSNSIRVGGNRVSYWEYRNFPQPNNAFLPEEVEGSVYGVMLLQSVDCTAMGVQSQRVVVYGEGRQEINRFDYGNTTPLTQPAEGSSAHAVLQFVCNPANHPAPASAPAPAPEQQG